MRSFKPENLFCLSYTVFTNGGHAGKNWCLVMKALEDKQKLQMKTFSELTECLARIPPKITLYGRLFKYNYVGCLLLLMFSSDLLFAIKRDAYISSKKQDDFVGFGSIRSSTRQVGDDWRKAAHMLSQTSH